jgi:hypothetical protein
MQMIRLVIVMEDELEETITALLRRGLRQDRDHGRGPGLDLDLAAITPQGTRGIVQYRDHDRDQDQDDIRPIVAHINRLHTA